MVHAKNYETAFTFVKVIQRKQLASFFPGHGVVLKSAIVWWTALCYYGKLSLCAARNCEVDDCHL